MTNIEKYGGVNAHTARHGDIVHRACIAQSLHTKVPFIRQPPPPVHSTTKYVLYKLTVFRLSCTRVDMCLLQNLY